MREIHIADPNDPRLADYRDLSRAERLQGAGAFVAEGRFVVRRVLESGRYRVRSLLLSEAARRQLSPALEGLGETPVYVCRSPDFLPVTGYNIHRGALALVDRPAPRTLSEIVETGRRLVVLEDVANADNVGGVFRNAAAFAFDAVLLSPNSCDPLYRKAIRTSMGASLSVPFATIEPWPEALHTLRVRGFTLAAFTPDGDAEPMSVFAERTAITDTKVALIFGSEGDGLSDAVKRLADRRVRIPISRAVDSLNLAVAAGIACAGLTRTADFA
jgi:tRNA G18 (ribose-2'-O)-methylase SpoU